MFDSKETYEDRYEFWEKVMKHAECDSLEE